MALAPKLKLAAAVAAGVAVVVLLALLVGNIPPGAGDGRAADRRGGSGFPWTAMPATSLRALDGSGNNIALPSLGQAGTAYTRVSGPNYADGVSTMIAGPSARYISNRIFNDRGQNIFSENDVSQWGWVWGQFLDHDIGLRDESPPSANARRSTTSGNNSAPEPGGGGPAGAAERLPYTPADPLEAFANDLGAIDFTRTPAAPGTGGPLPRQEINTISSYIDASMVYGVTPQRLDWLRQGSLDGNPSNNSAKLMLPGGYLPRLGARGPGSPSPQMDLMGPLPARPQLARVAGDVRANENIALTAVQTLMAREHNRIVAALPSSLTEESKFQIARRVVGAEVQYITYREFLPTLGVALDPYRGYDSTADPSLTNEFAVVGYRAHSMVHGQFDVSFKDGDFTTARMDAMRRKGIAFAAKGDAGEGGGGPVLTVPLNVSYGNPDVLQDVGLGRFLASVGKERQYRNDEQIDNTLRSVLFEIPRPGTRDPSLCSAPVVNPACFTGIQDLGAIDLARGRDHGMPSYNDMRRAYGLPPEKSFTDITGEATDRFPRDRLIDPTHPIDDPNILDFVDLRDADGNRIKPGTAAAREKVVSATHRSTLAARLRGVYGTVDRIDAFVGMVSEQHLPGTEFGELQLAIWKHQFQALRDGDRYFYDNDPILPLIKKSFGITFRHSLADIIRLNTGVKVPAVLFKAPAESDANPAPGESKKPGTPAPAAGSGSPSADGTSFVPPPGPSPVTPRVQPAGLVASRRDPGRRRRHPAWLDSG